ncbi:hypothetical protein [Nostoc sp.]
MAIATTPTLVSSSFRGLKYRIFLELFSNTAKSSDVYDGLRHFY